MAASVSVDFGPAVPGDRRFVVASVQFDNSYATGGEAISLGALGLTRLDFIQTSTVDFGYVSGWNGSKTEPKIQLFITSVTDSPLAEVASGIDLSSLSVQIVAYGA